MSTRTIALSRPEPEDAEPVDLVAVQADDELINALASGMSVSAGAAGRSDAEHVASILAAWKAEVDAEPLPELVDVDAGVAAVLAARRRPHRARHLASVAAAAALIVVTIGGVTVGSYSAQPEDALWPVAKVLYSERTTSIEAADRVEERITRAKQAIAAGQPALAELELRAAAADLAVIRPEEGGIQLAAVQDFLVAKAEETPPGVPTDPGAPLVTDLSRAVPPGAAISTPPSSVQPPAPASSATSDPGSSAPDSQPADSPAAPAPVDPQVARVLPPPDPAPEDEPGRPVDPVEPPAPQVPEDEVDEPTSEPEPVPQPVDPEVAPAPAPDPAPQLEGTESLGATAAETSTDDAPATS